MDPAPALTLTDDLRARPVHDEGGQLATLLERALVVLDGAEWCLPDEPVEARERVVEAAQLLERALELVHTNQFGAASSSVPLHAALDQLATAARRWGQLASIEVPEPGADLVVSGSTLAAVDAATLLRVATRALCDPGPRAVGDDRPTIKVRIEHNTLELIARSRRSGSERDACAEYLRVNLDREDAGGSASRPASGAAAL